MLLIQQDLFLHEERASAVFFKQACKCPQRNPKPDTQTHDLYILSGLLIIYLTAAESGQIGSIRLAFNVICLIHFYHQSQYLPLSSESGISPPSASQSERLGYKNAASESLRSPRYFLLYNWLWRKQRISSEVLMGRDLRSSYPTRDCKHHLAQCTVPQ